MISLTSKGSFNGTRSFLNGLLRGDIYRNLSNYGQKGVDALAAATPYDSGLTARSWAYRIVKTKSGPSIEWYNTNINSGANIAILIQYGHGTGTGGWVNGVDYINPAIRPIFDEIAQAVWREVNNAGR